MKIYWIFCLLLTAMSLSAQTLDTKKLKSIKAEEPYENVYSKALYHDKNSSVFIIFIKKQVPKHYHKTHTETVIILEGRAEMFLGGQVFEVGPGDQIIIPEGVHHSAVVKSKKPLKVVSIQSPYFDNTDRHLVK